MKNRLIALLCMIAMVFTMASCGSEEKTLNVIDDKYRTFYEVFVYSFYDSNGDGIGDLKGLTEKLDYINDGDDSTDTDLGCNGIWLMPINPSTTYHKYDVKDYFDIDPQYGTMSDFETFLAECEKRDIHVIMDLVLNHTSTKHPWFIAATDYLREIGNAAPDEADCKYFGYYNFSTEKKNSTWYQVSGTNWYYEAPFWSEMPDLNLYNEDVRADIAEITQFWFDKGVSGFRLDAVKEFVSGNTTANVEILTWFNDMVKAQNPDAYLVGEAWTDVSAYVQYYDSGVDSFFDFQFATQDGIIAKVLKDENGGAIKYGQAVESIAKQIAEHNPEGINAPFYTNHDNARSAGYYSGELSVERTKMAHALNLLMSGNAFIYYGEELGMKGSGKDENKRAPMQWSSDAEAEGMCDGPAAMDNIKMKFPALDEQQADPNSLYNYVKAVIKVRNTYPEIARGEVDFLEEVSDSYVCVLKKVYEGKEIVLIYNISSQENTLDISTITVNGKNLSEMKVSDVLLTGETEVVAENGNLILPAYSIAIYQ